MNGERLDPRFVTLQRVHGWLMFVTVMGMWGIASAAVWLVPGVPILIELLAAGAGVVLAPLLIWGATGWPATAYRHWSYRVDEAGIEIAAGVVFRRVVNVPRARVQHTDVEQGPLERRFGLGTLVVYTAGTQFARVTLPGLRHETALRIRDALLPGDRPDAL